MNMQLVKMSTCSFYAVNSDSGPGISSETQSRLFTKFNRVAGAGDNTTLSESAQGPVGESAGLGLFLAKKLAELMDGGMNVVSVVGKGATFAFFVKSAKAREPEIVFCYALRGQSREYPGATLLTRGAFLPQERSISPFSDYSVGLQVVSTVH